jgi:hypothetical protein
MQVEPLLGAEPIEDATAFRAALFDERHETASRLFNGFVKQTRRQVQSNQD